MFRAFAVYCAFPSGQNYPVFDHSGPISLIRTISLLKPRVFAAAVLLLAALLSSQAPAQVPIPLQEQIRAFSTLPAAQQQALIRELQRQLPPAQRAAVLGMLQGGAGNAGDSAGATEAADPGLAVLEMLDGVEFEADDARLTAGDTLVIEFSLREGTAAVAGEGAQLAPAALRLRLEDGNPYELDRLGRLQLPGIPAIELSGLDVDQATVRLGAERDLRSFDLIITHLPLEPVGTAALQPFGYNLFEGVPSTFAPASDIPVPVDYIIGPGDTINVQLFGNENAEYFLNVSRDGSVNFPEIGPLNVTGLSFTEVRNLINERVGEQLIGVRASVTLGELRSVRVFVLGDVRQPGSYTVSSLSTMTNALFAGGGVAPIGSLRRIALNRAGETVTTLDLYDLLLRGDTRGDARLQPGDVIFVPPIGAAVAVDGEVRRPAIYELDDERTVADIVSLAGGVTATASARTVKLERIVPGRGVSVTELDLTSGAAGATGIRDGDVLRVEPGLELLEDSISLVGNVERPGLYQWHAGMRISDLLPSSELLRPETDLGYVLVRRELAANVQVELLSVDLEAIWQRRAGANDLEIRPRDTIYVLHAETGRAEFIDPLLDELALQTDPGEPSPVVTITGQIRAEGDYPLEPNMKISDLLRAGGGLSDAAYAVEAELTRYSVIDGQRRQTELQQVNLQALLAGTAAADIVLSPYDYLSIREISGWYDRDSVVLSGEFIFPGRYPIRPGETLSSVVTRAGGLTEFAFPRGSVFTRTELMEREAQQLRVLAGRIESDLAALSLSDPGASDALATGQSLLNQLRSAEATGRLVIRLDDIMAGRMASDIVLQGEDQLFVPEFKQEVTVIGEVQYPTSHAWEAALSRDEYIDMSGGLSRRADGKRIYVVRANGEVVVDSGGRWFRRGGTTTVGPGDTVVVPMDVDRGRAIARWSNITQVIYNLAVAAAAINSF